MEGWALEDEIHAEKNVIKPAFTLENVCHFTNICLKELEGTCMYGQLNFIEYIFTELFVIVQ